MIAKVLPFVAVVAVAHATVVYNSGLLTPRLLNSGILAPGLSAPALLSAPIASTSSVVATPGAITTDKRVIGAAPGVIARAPLLYGNGLVSPIGLRSAGILAAPGLVKTILK